MPGLARADKTSKDSSTRKRAVLLALRYYSRELRRQWRVSLPALTFPAFGNVCISYLAPLAIAALVGHLAAGGKTTFGAVVPYVAVFGGALLAGEVLWRI